MTELFHRARGFLLSALREYHNAILWIEHYGPANDKLLRINAGLAIWLATAFIRGRSWGDARNLLPLAILAGLNELADYLFTPKWTLSGSAWELLWTFFWPVTLVWAIGRGSSGRGRRR